MNARIGKLVLVAGVLASFLCARADETPDAASDIPQPIVSPLIPSSQQAAALRDHAWRYLQQQAGAPITVPPEIQNDERSAKDFWWSAKRYRQAESIKDANERTRVLCRLIGEHWLFSQSLLQSRYVDYRLVGIGFCILASDCALKELKDARLAQCILESEVLPRLDDAREEAWQFLSLDNLLSRLITVYGAQQDAASQDKLRLVYELRLSRATERDDADYLRIQIAGLLDAGGKPDAALKYLGEVEAPRFKPAAQGLIEAITKKQAAKQAASQANSDQANSSR